MLRLAIIGCNPLVLAKPQSEGDRRVAAARKEYESIIRLAVEEAMPLLAKSGTANNKKLLARITQKPKMPGSVWC